MNISQIIDIAIGALLLLGVITGLKEGIFRKFINFFITLAVFYATYKFSPIIISNLNLNFNFEFSFFSGSNLKSFMSLLISHHLFNALCYIAVFFVLSIIAAIIKKIIFSFVKKRKKGEVSSTKVLNRLFGGLWGLIASSFFIALVMLMIVPLTGLNEEVQGSIIGKPLYKMANSTGNKVTGSDEGVESLMICTLSNKKITMEECGYVYKGMLVLSSGVTKKNFVSDYFNVFTDTIDYNEPEQNTLDYLEIYYQTLFTIPALTYLSGSNTSTKLSQATELNIKEILTYSESIPNNIYTNDNLYNSISKMYDHFELTALKDQVLRTFVIPA